MKKIPGCIVLAIAVALFTLSCKKDEPETAVEVATQKLTQGGEWGVESVAVDDVYKDSLFANLSLSFQKDTYTAKNGEPVWHEVGKWKFSSNDARVLVVDDTVNMDVISLEDRKMVIGFQWKIDSLEAGRSKSFGHYHTVTLIQ